MNQVKMLATIIITGLTLFSGHDQSAISLGLLTPTVANAQAAAPSTIGAQDILGNPDYPAFSYGGYREATRDQVPTVEQLKEDMRILSAMGIKLLRTYNTQQYDHAANLLDAIDQLRQEQPGFEMYVMLGAWIECQGAWTPGPNHEAGNVENNTAEINAAVELANQYPEIVKIIAVGNEAMVHWAASYFVRPDVVRKWVDHLQGLKASGDLPAGLWITSSDNFASWGGGDHSYRTDELAALIKAVDFVSLHTYPFHDTHYNPEYWVSPKDEAGLSSTAKADAAMQRAKAYAIAQYQETADYIKSLGIDKPIHIGETGWATIASTTYGPTGSQAADQYKQKLYYDAMRDWTDSAGMTCFYFEAFDEQWKDAGNAEGSENHFGLINLQGQAKYALWELVDQGKFQGLTRGGVPITKTYQGDEDKMLADLLAVPATGEMGGLTISTVNDQRTIGEPVTQGQYIVLHESMSPDESNDLTYPSESLKLNVWEGTCAMELTHLGEIKVSTGTGAWWGCALEIQADGKGENLTEYKAGRMHFQIKGAPGASLDIGFQTGLFTAGTQTNNQVTFGPGQPYQLTEQWASHSISITDLNNDADLTDVTAVLFLKSDRGVGGNVIEVRNIYFSKE